MAPIRCRPGLLTLAWGSGHASGSLSFAAAAWLLSGLTAAPLLNGLLPSLAALPALLPLPRRLRLGYGLQTAAILLLLAVGALRPRPGDLPATATVLVAVPVLAAGMRMAQPPLQRRLLAGEGIAPATLRVGTELGRLVGHLLTGLLFPLGRALLQFANALLLLLPLAPLVRHGSPSPGAAADSPGGGLDRACLLQGALLGSLFALLPLWVRREAAGSCFDFGMVLGAYGLGRSGADLLAARWAVGRSRWSGVLPYLSMGGLLVGSQAVPGWGAVLLFLPFGLLAALTDRRLVALLPSAGGEEGGWETLERSATLGGLAGGLGMAALVQLTGLALALPLQVAAFTLAAGALGRGGRR